MRSCTSGKFSTPASTPVFRISSGIGAHAVVRAERHDVISAADLLSRCANNRQILVQPHQNVLNLPAPRAEHMPHVVHRRIAHTQKIRPAPLPSPSESTASSAISSNRFPQRDSSSTAHKTPHPGACCSFPAQRMRKAGPTPAGGTAPTAFSSYHRRFRKQTTSRFSISPPPDALSHNPR